MAEKINFTKKTLEEIEAPTEKGARSVFQDNKIHGLELRVTTAGSKTFSVYKKLNGKPVRVTLGKFPDMTPDQARKLAQKTLSVIAEGINPNEIKKAEQAVQITLREVFDNMIKTRSYKEGTIIDYNKSMNNAFKDWQHKPLSQITRDKVLQRHRKLSETAPTRANNAMRVLRAVFNFAKGAYEDENDNSLFTDNPVIKLNNLRAWNPSRRKQTIIQRHELASWFKAVQKNDLLLYELKESTTRDYLIFVLFTGLRREEAASLEWSNVDLKGRTIIIIDPKNRDDFRLPLSNYLFELLNRRYELCGDIKYVFPGLGKTGHIVSPGTTIKRVREESGIQFTIHDLRRTFITIAESLDISTIALKRLINHRIDTNDVTAGYVIHDVERLRQPMQRITDFMLSHTVNVKVDKRLRG